MSKILDLFLDVFCWTIFSIACTGVVLHIVIQLHQYDDEHHSSLQPTIKENFASRSLPDTLNTEVFATICPPGPPDERIYHALTPWFQLPVPFINMLSSFTVWNFSNVYTMKEFLTRDIKQPIPNRVLPGMYEPGAFHMDFPEHTRTEKEAAEQISKLPAWWDPPEWKYMHDRVNWRAEEIVGSRRLWIVAGCIGVVVWVVSTSES